MANFCAKCGNPLPADARFCPGCGAPVSDVPGGKRAETPDHPESLNDKNRPTTRNPQHIPAGSPRAEMQGVANLDLFFYIPMGILAAMGLLTLMFIGPLMRVGRGAQGLFYFVLNLALAAAIWKWPYQEYKRKNSQKARKGVAVFFGVILFFLLVSLVNSQMITAFFDMIALGSFAYLFYKLGGGSWSF